MIKGKLLLACLLRLEKIFLRYLSLSETENFCFLKVFYLFNRLLVRV